MEGSILGHALITILILLQFPTQINSSLASGPLPSNTYTEYIKTSCSNTTYPKLCYNSLLRYADKIKTNPKLLTHTALNVSLIATKSAYSLMKNLSRIHGLKPREAAAMADCVDVVGDSVYELQRSIKEMDHAKGSSSELVINDVQTWVSAALTDDNTCMDGFDGTAMNGEVKTVVKNHMVKVSQLTSNALALINRYASS